MSAVAAPGLRTAVSLAGPWLTGLSFLARLPAALGPTGTLVMVTALSGIGNAGVVAGLFWGGQAVGGPILGRLADRRGHRAVLLCASLANALALTALVAAAVAEAPLAAQAALAAMAGLSVPQVGPLSRTRWIALAEGRPRQSELVARAVSLDTTLDEVAFMAGPALVGLLALAVHPAAGLVLAAAVMAAAGTLFAVHPTAPKGTPVSRGLGGGVLPPALKLLFLMTLLQGLVLGATNSGINALAADLGDQGLAGLIWGGTAVTSSLAGVAVTVLRRGTDFSTQLRLAIAAQALLTLPLLVVDAAAGAALSVAALGLAVAPHLIALFALAEQAAPAARMAEAMTLLGSGLIAGQGIAAVLAGRLAGAHGYTWAFTVACAAAAAGAALACSWRQPTSVQAA